MAIYCKAFLFVQKTELVRQWLVCAPLETYHTELGKYSHLSSNSISNFKNYSLQFTAVLFFTLKYPHCNQISPLVRLTSIANNKAGSFRDFASFWTCSWGLPEESSINSKIFDEKVKLTRTAQNYT